MSSVAAMLVVLAPLADPELACATGFEAAVDRHFAAIEARDIDAYLSTIGNRDGDLMILPDGTVWDSRDAIAQGHRDWFSDATWTFVAEPVRRVERDEFGLIVQRVEVRRPDREATPFLLSILFAREDDGCWYVLHDQNTILPTDPAAETP